MEIKKNLIQNKSDFSKTFDFSFRKTRITRIINTLSIHNKSTIRIQFSGEEMQMENDGLMSFLTKINPQNQFDNVIEGMNQ